MTMKSHWVPGSKMPHFPKLREDLKVDAVVVGAGIMGATAAYLLKKAGKTVALLERDHCGKGDTGNTTAHLTYVTDTRITELTSTFGKDHAQAAWDAGRAAIDQIEAIVKAEEIDCGFARVPAFLHAPWKGTSKDEADKLRRDAALADELGFDARYVDSIAWVDRPGVRFANQARFHPLRYLAGLLPRIAGDGSHVFESSEVSEFQEEPLAVKANKYTITCDYIVIATHVPLVGVAGFLSATLFQTKIAPYSSYVIGAKVPKATVPDALFFDTTDPYYYLRVDPHPKHDYVIFGGEDHKTGQETNTEENVQRLEAMLASILPEAKIDARWTGQVVETHDGLPFIGETAPRQFAATGFSGNGMTFGTLAGMMAADAALGKKNPWSDLFDVNRKKLASVWDYVKENIDYPYYYLKDKLKSAEGASLSELPSGEGKILKLGSERVAAYRSPQGKVTTLSPVCTHMGCNVHWNLADSTWDCPCHGSRFAPTGEVLGGPAETPLEEIKSN